MWYRFKKHWFLLGLACVAFAAFQWSDSFEVYTRWVPTRWIVMSVMLLNGLSLETAELVRSLKRPGQVVMAVFWGYFIVAFLGYPASGLLHELHRDFALGLLIISAAPTTLSSSIIWTRMAGGNDAFTLLVTVVSNSVSFLAVPAILLLTVGRFISLNPLDMIGKLVLVVLLPVVVAQLLRQVRFVAGLASRHKTSLSTLAQLLILNMVFVGAVQGILQMGRKGGSLGFFEFAVLAALVTAVHVLAAAACWTAAKILRWDRAERWALVFAGSQKTLPASLYVCAEFFPSFAFAPIPCVMYHVCQLLMDSWLVEIARRRQRPSG